MTIELVVVYRQISRIRLQKDKVCKSQKQLLMFIFYSDRLNAQAKNSPRIALSGYIP